MSKTLETKKKILDLLKEREMTVTELSEALNLAVPTVAQHIAELQDMGAIEKMDSEHFKKLKFYKVAENPSFMNTALAKLLLGILIIAIIGAAVYLYSTYNTNNQASSVSLYVGNSVSVRNVTILLSGIVPINGVNTATFTISKNGMQTGTAVLGAGKNGTVNINGTKVSILVHDINSTKELAVVSVSATAITTTTTIATPPPPPTPMNSTTTTPPMPPPPPPTPR